MYIRWKNIFVVNNDSLIDTQTKFFKNLQCRLTKIEKIIFGDKNSRIRKIKYIQIIILRIRRNKLITHHYMNIIN